MADDMSAWRGYPVHPAIACLNLRMAAADGANGRSAVSFLSQSMRESCVEFLSSRGIYTPCDETLDDLLKEIAESGDEKDREITRLQSYITQAQDELACFMADNTEDEEMWEDRWPDIDYARDLLIEAFN